MDKLSKTSLNTTLSEYLADLKRAGVQDFYRDKDAEIAAENAKRSDEPQRTDGEAPAATRPAKPTAPPRPATSAKPLSEAAKRLQTIAAEVARCDLCQELANCRTQTVFGSGNPEADLVFIGEGPGAEEDLRGLPFVGRSGQLLTDMIEKGMGIPRESVYICNIVRCRPPANRNPTPDEANACRPFLDATLEVVAPKYICCLGAIAATNLLHAQVPIGKLRGIVHEYGGAKVVCTYHPAYLLRNPGAKKDAWQDLQLLMSEMGLEPPKKR